MRFRVLTLFPDLIRLSVQTSILGRAAKAGLLDVRAVDIRDYADNDYGKVDDTLFGGGTGMLMMCEPVYRAWHAVRTELGGHPRTVFLSAQGAPFTQAKAIELSSEPALILLCGHYEGIDQRVLDTIVDEEISIGDFVLTGGELPALTVIDAVARMLPGVLPNSEAIQEESHMGGTLEGPQFTRPATWKGHDVPAILLSGHHVKIKTYRRLSSLKSTMVKRPDMFNRLRLEPSEAVSLELFIRSSDDEDRK
jgi:tRNA (guanine37-N1)-methyltransferase